MARAGLTRDAVIEAAVRIADAEGLKALTMRRLAADLDVEAMSLYNHVANKADLQGGIVDRMWGEVDLALDEPDWRGAIERLATSMRAAIIAHPWFFQLPATIGGMARVQIIDAQLSHMRRGGLTPERAFHAQHMLDAHVLGFAWLNVEFSDDSASAARGAEVLAQIPEGMLEDLIAHARLHMENPPGGSGFAVGLGYLLDGIAGSATGGS